MTSEEHEAARNATPRKHVPTMSGCCSCGFDPAKADLERLSRMPDSLQRRAQGMFNDLTPKEQEFLRKRFGK